MAENNIHNFPVARRPDWQLIARLAPGLCVLAVALSVAFFILLAIIGTVRNYSPVPFMDMWTGFLDFYIRATAGDWSAWWQPHVDHRIVLSRLFFWLDLRFFGGGGWFSLAITYICIALVGVILALIWREQTSGPAVRDLISDGRSRRLADWCVLGFIAAWIFSWSQSQNFTFAFQNQFVLAQLLPLAGLYYLHLSASVARKTTRYFALAMLCGVLAIGSMANGVLALPVMTAYAIAVRMQWKRTALLAALSVLCIILYFYHFAEFSAPSAGPGLIRHLLDNKLAAAGYVLSYFGSPFTYLLTRYATFDLMPNIQPVASVLWVGGILSIALLCLTALSFFRSIAAPRQATLTLMLVLFLVYLILGSMVTAAGRLGFQTPYTSRYVTPALYAWAALLLLYWPRIRRLKTCRNLILAVLAVLFYGFMVPFQFNALADERPILAEWKFAALALEMQVNDPLQIGYVAPSFLGAPKIARAARERHLSIFGMKPIRDAHLLIGRELDLAGIPPCIGRIDSIATLPDDANYVRISGWLFDGRATKAPAALYVLDASNKIVGVGLTGFSRLDVTQTVGKKAAFSGFRAYLLSIDKDQKVAIFSPADRCDLAPNS